MALTIGNFQIEAVDFGEKTRLRGRSLIVDKDDLSRFLLNHDDRIKAVDIALAQPGESTRIICVKDVIEPWCKVHGDNPGDGIRHILKNVTVVTCGKIIGFQEGIIDMSGPGALYSPFSKTMNVVLDIEVTDDLTPHQHEEVVRRAGHLAAAFLGEAGRQDEPDERRTFDTLDTSSNSHNLPRVVYLYLLLSQGLLHDSYVFGRNAREGMPCILPPHIILDGAVTSGNCVSACDKNTTYHHQNHPLLLELLERHGKDLCFAGVVLSNEPVRLEAKEASAKKALKLAMSLDPEGVIISKEGFGNPDADQMMLIRGLEKAGVRTVALTDEFAGADGASQSLADVTKEADAMISVGNANARLVLPPLARILGPLKDLTSLAGAYPQSLRADGSLEIELQGIIGSTNELGMQTMSCREV